MPRTKTAKKALRQNVTRRERNLKRDKQLKDAVKQVKKAIVSKEETKSLMSAAFKTIDKMAKVKLIKKGKADRMKSRLAKNAAKAAK